MTRQRTGEWETPGDVADQGYRSDDVCRLAGITARQLDHWTRTELVWSSVRQASGSGTQRRWSRDDIAYLRLIRELLDLGVDLTRVRDMARPLRLSIDSRTSKPYFLVTGGAAASASTQDVFEAIHDNRSCLVVDIDAVCLLVSEVAQASSSTTSPDPSSTSDGGACAAPGEGLHAGQDGARVPPRLAGDLHGAVA